jgi:tetratricopeptide (TPR) repeat protein
MKDLFISYDQADSIQARSIEESLKKSGYSSWVFEKSGICGPHHRQQTEDAIAKCKAFILLISKDSVFSDEVEREVSHAHNSRKLIFPILHRINWERAMGANETFRSVLEGKRTGIVLEEAKFTEKMRVLVESLKSEGVFGSLRLRKPKSSPQKIPRIINPTPPEPNFVGRKKLLETITDWYKNPHIHIGSLIGLGGEGKSSIARKWFDSMEENNIKPDVILWWGFYRNAYLDRFLCALLECLSHGRINLKEISSTWAKVDKIINALSQEGEYLIILDGFEEMQKGQKCRDEFGCMQHQELSQILRYLTEAKFRGLCLITSRYPLTDIEKYEGTTYRKQNIEGLSIEDGRLLFERMGVVGDQKEIDKVIKQCEGHALILTLLAKYLVEDFEGDIREAEKIPISGLGPEDKVRQILNWYAEQLSEEQLSFMKIFSLFTRVINKRDFEGVFRSTIKTTINKKLIEMDLFSFNRMMKNLCDRSLIFKGQDAFYTTHPLIKGYFKSIIEKDDYIACNRRIYEYIETYAPSGCETLEEMISLFEQVHHGCNAGLYDNVFAVYKSKILRGDDFYLVYRLGAWKTNFSLVSNFFPESDLTRMPMVNKRADQRYLLTSAGLSLFAIGRTSEAEGLFKKAINIDIEDKEWKNACIDIEDLVALQFRMGNIEGAHLTVKNGLKIAKNLKTKDKQYKAILKAWSGYIHFAEGKTINSEKLFENANSIYEKLWPHVGGLFGIFWEGHAKFLIKMGKVKEAFRANKRNLQVSIDNNWPAHESRCLRISGELERINRKYKESESNLCKGLENVRKIGIAFLEIDALIELGRLNLETKEYKIATDYLENALKLVNRTFFKLYEPEAEVVLAKVYLALGDIDKTKELAKSAYEKARQMNYYWPQKDAEELLNSFDKEDI